MIIIAELNALVDILHKAGMDYDDANDIVIKATGIAQDKKISVIKATMELSDPEGSEVSVEYHLCIALKGVSIIELNKLSSLHTIPE